LYGENIFETETDSSNDILDMMNTAQGNFDEP
jgi:hypothetical protein